MNNINHQEAVQEAVKKAFRGRKYVEAKAVPKYPISTEREYERVTRAYVRIIRTVLQKHLPTIVEACKESRMDSRYDALTPKQIIERELNAIAAEIEDAADGFGLDEAISGIAQLANKRSTAEWKKIIKKTFGINILEDYYKGETYRAAINEWIALNTDLIKSIPTTMLEQMQQIIMDGFEQGKTIRDLKTDIQDAYDISKRHAELLARDQTAKLNAEITKMQQQDAGVKRYKWSTSRDARVRECHAELENHIIEWDNPPEMWYETKHGRVYTGRFCNPGEDYECRCCAIPVFDWETIDLPVGDTEK